jgi:hypothetical protein
VIPRINNSLLTHLSSILGCSQMYCYWNVIHYLWVCWCHVLICLMHASVCLCLNSTMYLGFACYYVSVYFLLLEKSSYVQESKLVCFWYSNAWVVWCCLNALCVCMNAYGMYVSFLFPAIESNDDCAEEGEVFEYQEEGDQGQAHQGKPSTCAYLNPIISLCIALLLSPLLCIVFVYCY